MEKPDLENPRVGVMDWPLVLGFAATLFGGFFAIVPVLVNTKNGYAALALGVVALGLFQVGCINRRYEWKPIVYGVTLCIGYIIVGALASSVENPSVLWATWLVNGL